jgi:hypothetical protein
MRPCSAWKAERASPSVERDDLAVEHERPAVGGE